MQAVAGEKDTSVLRLVSFLFLLLLLSLVKLVVVFVVVGMQGAHWTRWRNSFLIEIVEFHSQLPVWDAEGF